jgi:hypothetical protein
LVKPSINEIEYASISLLPPPEIKSYDIIQKTAKGVDFEVNSKTFPHF